MSQVQIMVDDLAAMIMTFEEGMNRRWNGTTYDERLLHIFLEVTPEGRMNMSSVPMLVKPEDLRAYYYSYCQMKKGIQP
jgi:hypothetical protein